ncbi:hypothetical protein GGI15_002057 [Coemansia interrupta]|uniref:N-acetyltransferase domain-containing protein n=1 Tax=Coemansia interrupta TaxID=1126814 RepID=A0A9W8HIY6_9FUNG|nr:hypothetical protein GGI15_002057 [Coemansia interrupta]
MSTNLTFRNLRDTSEVHAAHALEAANYPASEAASLPTTLYRFTHAPHLFLGAFSSPQNQLLGYIMSTQSASPLVTHESMETHDPEGSTVCIHSVCVARGMQRLGVASRLLREYTEGMGRYNEGMGGGRRIGRLALLSRETLVPLYERAGYRSLGPSNVVHGEEKWYDCVLDL